MALVAEESSRLCDTDGFLVESPEGDVGRVEEVWLDVDDEPCALAVRTGDGRHALLLDEDIVTVDREHRWVVVPSAPRLLELAPPRISLDGGARLAASWETTGEAVELPSGPARGRFRRAKARRDLEERPLWLVIACLYGWLALAVALMLGLAFGIAALVGGAAY
jgi:hypothetical protein